MEIKPDPASFRDPSGHVYSAGERILRSVTSYAAADFAEVEATGLLQRLMQKGWLVETRSLDDGSVDLAEPDVSRILEHARIAFVSYPYEWSFSTLQAAALHHLDVHLEALEAGVTLSDGSAYNIQFDGCRPVFIDVLSFRPYREGEYWVGHRQFSEEFLCPLLLRAQLGLPANAWMRGTLSGLPIPELSRLLPLRSWLSWRCLVHLHLPTRFQRSAVDKGAKLAEEVKQRPLPLAGYRLLLEQQRRWIAGLRPRGLGTSRWHDYERTQSYDDDAQGRKQKFIAEFTAAVKPAMLWDLGCNTGVYSALALSAGAEKVIGFDNDHDALEIAFARAKDNQLDFLPLYGDAANPSPDQGWRCRERKALAARARPDALIALAFVHHLAIGRNIPLASIVEWLTELAPNGVIEFVQKDDDTIKEMLRLRSDIFPDYSEEAFQNYLARHARIVKTERLGDGGRTLFWYARNG